MSKPKAKRRDGPKITTPLTADEVTDIVQRMKIAAMIEDGTEPYASLPIRSVLRLMVQAGIPVEVLK